MRRFLNLLILSLVFATGINAQENASSYIEFDVLEEGQPAPYDSVIMDEAEFKTFETNEVLMYACFSNQKEYKAIQEIDKKIVKRYKFRTALSVMGSVKNLVGLGMYLSGVPEFKKWGAGLMVLGTVELSISLAI